MTDNKKFLLRAAVVLALVLGAAAAPPPAAAEEAASQSTAASAPADSAAAAPAETPAPAAEGAVTLDEMNFPDPAFLDCVRAFDADGDGALSESERAAVTSLDVRAKGIRSLEGVGFFPTLTRLNCIGNALTELPLNQTPSPAPSAPADEGARPSGAGTLLTYLFFQFLLLAMLLFTLLRARR